MRNNFKKKFEKKIYNIVDIANKKIINIQKRIFEIK